jgi:hypothetical protein
MGKLPINIWDVRFLEPRLRQAFIPLDRIEISYTQIVQKDM